MDAPPPKALVAPCDKPRLTVKTNADLVNRDRARGVALDNCAAKVDAIRSREASDAAEAVKADGRIPGP